MRFSCKFLKEFPWFNLLNVPFRVEYVFYSVFFISNIINRLIKRTFWMSCRVFKVKNTYLEKKIVVPNTFMNWYVLINCILHSLQDFKYFAHLSQSMFFHYNINIFLSRGCCCPLFSMFLLFWSFTFFLVIQEYVFNDISFSA